MSDLVPARRPIEPSPRRVDRFVDNFRHDDMVDATTLGYAYSRRRTTEDTTTAPHGLAALLQQAEWWRPQAGPAVLIAQMTDTHRLHTARFVVHRCEVLFGMGLEDVQATPLFQSLLTTAPALPLPKAPGWNDMLERATHWSTCPRNRSLAVPACSPECTPKREAWDRARELMVDYNGDAAG